MQPLIAAAQSRLVKTGLPYAYGARRSAQLSLSPANPHRFGKAEPEGVVMTYAPDVPRSAANAGAWMADRVAHVRKE